MKWLTLEYIKEHSRIDFDCDDFLLTAYADSAEATILNILRRTYSNIEEEYAGVPAPILHASLMLVELAYTQRAPVRQQNLFAMPYTFDMLVKPYMRLSDSEDGTQGHYKILTDGKGRALHTFEGMAILVNNQ